VTKVAKPRAPRKRASEASASSAMPAALSHDQRRHYIEIAAYYIAERRGFHGGKDAEDWAQAEREIDLLIAQGQLKAD